MEDPYEVGMVGLGGLAPEVRERCWDKKKNGCSCQE